MERIFHCPSYCYAYVCVGVLLHVCVRALIALRWWWRWSRWYRMEILCDFLESAF